jgi:NAD-dependent dihydropyrimidine dehydrogenase PreA subunit
MPDEKARADENPRTETDVYRRLQQHIDNMPVGFPATKSGVEIRILKHLFSEKEAEMALYLSALPEPLDKIHARAKKDGFSLRELGVGLARLAKKGAILKSEVKGQPAFSKAMLAIGMFEFQVNRLSKTFHSDVMQYMEEEFSGAFFTRNTSQMRTIPINEEILPERSIGSYDGAKKLVMESDGPLAVINCVCRQGMDLQEEPCQLSDIRETCLLLGGLAEQVIASGAGRELSKEEMVGLLERADDVGMVLQPQNTQDPHFICCCCGCCCGVLVSAKKLPKPAEYFDTNYLAGVHEELCVECGTCQDRCAMDAIAYENGIAVVDEYRCIGCGLCVSTCPDGAIHLSQREEMKTPPKSERALYMKIMQDRFGPLGTARIAARKALGLKI